ncbi:hypothetical protein JTB14_013226 [Gonioctena quinquepunctata]|nr:hypothetical protein JTB14_013226 [Gonioctena quinquepunctata]
MVSLYVAIPFLIAMIVLYLLLWLWPSGTDSSEEPKEHCDAPRIVGIVRKPYDDDREIELICTGIIVSKNSILTLGECIPSGKNVIRGSDSNYFAMSGSKYWSKFCNKNRVIDFKELNEVGVLTIDGEFSACIRKGTIQLTKDASTYSVKGWKVSTRKMYDPITEIDVSPSDIAKVCDILGGAIFAGDKLYGLVKQTCEGTGQPVVALGNLYNNLKQNLPENDIEE